MIREPDSLYYAERLQAERKAALAATCEAARAAHQALADHYAKLLGDCEEADADAAATPPQLFLVAQA